ncbi:MAG: SRPBCC family protein [Devosia nanyangense]|uniref:SRPBCC family protein n=1 Tax=Devosia nanyangense TaxID=1228055 RepID=A0A933L4P2_9HYPH|nr:SRPBCC family protein [Devosia nanyangense]
MANAHVLGTFERRDDHIDVHFERHYPRPPETVWSALTEPARLADWMGVSHIEPRAGGRIDLMLDGPHPSTGRVVVWDPPHVLEFTWSNTHAPDSTIRYELARDGAGTRLVFTHQRMPYVHSALMLPGWHHLLARLESLLEGAGSPGPGWRAMQAIYVDHYQLSGVTLDA